MNEREWIRKQLREDTRIADWLMKRIEDGTFGQYEEKEFPAGTPLNLVIGSDSQITGAKQMRCECNTIGWLSPSSQEIAAKHDGPVFFFCLTCIPKTKEAYDQFIKEKQQDHGNSGVSTGSQSGGETSGSV